MGPTCRFIVIEADDDRRGSVKRALLSCGYAVRYDAPSCDGLSEVALNPPPNFVVAGIELLGVDVAGALRQFCSEHSLPILALSPGGCDLGKFAIEGPVYSYLEFPLRPALLPLAISIAECRFREHRQLAADTSAALSQLHNRKMIERAKGLLMKEYKLDEETAFHKLQQTARRHGKKLADVAELIIALHDTMQPLGSHPVAAESAASESNHC